MYSPLNASQVGRPMRQLIVAALNFLFLTGFAANGFLYFCLLWTIQLGPHLEVIFPVYVINSRSSNWYQTKPVIGLFAPFFPVKHKIQEVFLSEINLKTVKIGVMFSINLFSDDLWVGMMIDNCEFEFAFIFCRDSVWGVLSGCTVSGLDGSQPLSPVIVHDVKEIEHWVMRLLSAPAPIPGKTRVEVEVTGRYRHSTINTSVQDTSRKARTSK